MSGDPRFLSRTLKTTFAVAAAGAVIFYTMTMHLDYTSETHSPRAKIPVSGFAYDPGHANDHAGNFTAPGKASDRATGANTGRPLPPEPAQQDRMQQPFAKTPAPPAEIDFCVPPDLIDRQSWDNPAPGSKMAAFKSTVQAFLAAAGSPQQEYGIRDGAFENFDSASDPSTLLYALPRGRACPTNNYTYTLTLPGR